MWIESEFGFLEEIYEYIGTPDDQIFYALSGISYPDKKYEMRRKNALCYSFEYVYEGEGAIQENKKIYKVSAGDFFILHPNCYHHYYTSQKKPWKKIFLMIDGGIDLPSVLLNQYAISNITLFPHLNSPILLEEILELFKSGSTNIARKFETLLCSMIIKLAHISKSTVSDFSSINIAKKYIDKKIAARLTLDEIAEYTNISVSFLCREFKKAFGVTPYAYILNSKIEHAKTMLIKTGETVQTISERFSFADVPHFSRAFTKIVGMPPTAYRETHRNEAES